MLLTSEIISTKKTLQKITYLKMLVLSAWHDCVALPGLFALRPHGGAIKDSVVCFSDLRRCDVGTPLEYCFIVHNFTYFEKAALITPEWVVSQGMRK